MKIIARSWSMLLSKVSSITTYSNAHDRRKVGSKMKKNEFCQPVYKKDMYEGVPFSFILCPLLVKLKIMLDV